MAKMSLMVDDANTMDLVARATKLIAEFNDDHFGNLVLKGSVTMSVHSTKNPNATYTYTLDEPKDVLDIFESGHPTDDANWRVDKVAINVELITTEYGDEIHQTFSVHGTCDEETGIGLFAMHIQCAYTNHDESVYQNSPVLDALRNVVPDSVLSMDKYLATTQVINAEYELLQDWWLHQPASIK